MSRMHRDRVGGMKALGTHERKRLSIQLLAAALANGYLVGYAKGRIFSGPTKAVCVPVLNCYSCPGALGSCPVGSLQAVLGGSKHNFSFYVVGLIMLFGVVLGRLICGVLCPFGLFQDLLHRIPTKKLKIAPKIDRPLRYLKYVLGLVMVVLLPIFLTNAYGMAPPYFCKYVCPAGTLGGGIPLLLLNENLRQLIGFLFGWKMLLLLGISLASVFISRPFCKYLCPLGAFYALFNRFSFFQMTLNQEKCIDCGLCEKVCPMEVEVRKNINHPECIRCGRCQAVCPVGAIDRGIELKRKTVGIDLKA